MKIKLSLKIVLILLIFSLTNIFSQNNLSENFLISKDWVSDARYGIRIEFEKKINALLKIQVHKK
jgi:hypothetical protein